ncbi:MAG: transporter substrate-binding domain-containing protein [Spirochaetes bacterium]|nr:transporter substrate-binding domain-containing protein [Spirochaetota bacterium]
MGKKIFFVHLYWFLFLLPLTAQGDISVKDLYQTIIQRGFLKIGISTNYPPLNFNKGERGVEVEMAKELAAFFGVKAKMIPLQLTEYVAALEKREVDIVIAGLSRNLARARRIFFSEPYLTVTPAALVHKRVIPQTKFGDQFEQMPIRTVWDLLRIPGFKCAVKKGSTYELLLESKFPAFERVLVGTNEEGISTIREGIAHGFMHDSLYLHHLYRKDASLRNNFILLTGGNIGEAICIGIPFGETVLKNQIDVFLAEMKRMGIIQKWLEEYDNE